MMNTEVTSNLCLTCGKEYETEDKHDQHVKMVHEISIKMCQCGVKCNTRIEYNNHQKQGNLRKDTNMGRHIGTPMQKRRQHDMLSHWNSINI